MPAILNALKALKIKGQHLLQRMTINDLIVSKSIPQFKRECYKANTASGKHPNFESKQGKTVFKPDECAIVEREMVSGWCTTVATITFVSTPPPNMKTAFKTCFFEQRCRLIN